MKRRHPYPTKFKPLPSIADIVARYRYDAQLGRFYCVPGEYGNHRGIGCVERSGSNGYRYLNFSRDQGGSLAAHRVAWKVVYGVDPRGVIDHINGIRDDNRIENLRDVHPLVNAQNHHGNLWERETLSRKDAAKARRAAARLVTRQNAGATIRAMMGLGC